jgi:hypothetical protein
MVATVWEKLASAEVSTFSSTEALLSSDSNTVRHD